MAAGSTPYFLNDMGIAAIEVGTREFMCIGAKPPFDHPHIYLDMGTAAEIICPYCSTLYKFSAKLVAGDALPQAAIWHVEAA